MSANFSMHDVVKITTDYSDHDESESVSGVAYTTCNMEIVTNCPYSNAESRHTVSFFLPYMGRLNESGMAIAQAASAAE